MLYRGAGVLVVALSLFSSLGFASASSSDVASGVPIDAIWRLQQFELHFTAAKGRFHSCSSLHSKITSLLQAVGARAVIVNLDCSTNALVDRMFARVAIEIPIAATDENVRAATTHAPEKELIARLRNVRLSTPETIERFPAEWQRVTLTSRELRLGAEDCDLLEDLEQQVLRHVTTVRVVRKYLSCGSTMTLVSRPVLIVEALKRRTA